MKASTDSVTGHTVRKPPDIKPRCHPRRNRNNKERLETYICGHTFSFSVANFHGLISSFAYVFSCHDCLLYSLHVD